MHPVLLFYNLDNEKGRKIKLLCLRMKIKIRLVTKDEYSLPVGVLAGVTVSDSVSAKASATEGDFTDEMLVFKGFSNQLLDRFLIEMKKSHIERVVRKAVLTEQNIIWNSLQLYDELSAEAAAMNPSN